MSRHFAPKFRGHDMRTVTDRARVVTYAVSLNVSFETKIFLSQDVIHVYRIRHDNRMDWNC